MAEHAPDPSQSDDLEHVKAANHFFLMTSGRLLLHEFAHTVLEHHTAQGTPPEILKREEFEADAWADAWMLDKWRDYNTDEKVFVGRCMGIAFAHAPSLIFGIEREAASDSHPSPIQRISRSLTSICREEIQSTSDWLTFLARSCSCSLDICYSRNRSHSNGSLYRRPTRNCSRGLNPISPERPVPRLHRRLGMTDLSREMIKVLAAMSMRCIIAVSTGLVGGNYATLQNNCAGA